MTEEITRSTSQGRRRKRLNLRHWYEIRKPTHPFEEILPEEKKSEVNSNKLMILAATKLQMINVTDAWKNK
jgi:hypothetical protein